jgi:predicted RNA-binding protein with PUA-like domain
MNGSLGICSHLRVKIAFFKLQIPTPNIQRNFQPKLAKVFGVNSPGLSRKRLLLDGLDFLWSLELELMKSFWLVKQEPSSYSWSDLVVDGGTSWTGVRNFAARNNLRKMQEGDEVLFYHSGDEKAVVGIAKVMRTCYPDPTAKEGDWSTVDIAAVTPLKRPVTLREIKGNPRLKTIPLVRQARLSVMPLSEVEFREIVNMATGERI